jgi:hypothetical protein
MPAPFPHEARSKTSPPGKVADEIYAHYAWLARWSDEIVRDDEIDLKKLAQLALGPGSHCAHFARLTEDMTPEIVVAVEGRFYRDGREWQSREAEVSDLMGIRAAALALNEYVTKQVPEARVLSERVWTIDPNEPPEIERTKKMAKPHPVIAFVEKLRAEFAD